MPPSPDTQKFDLPSGPVPRPALIPLFLATFLLTTTAAIAEDAVVNDQAAAELAAQAEEFRGRAEEALMIDEPESPRIESVDAPGVPAAADEIRFEVRQVLFEGNTVFSSEQLALLAAEVVGKSVSLADLQKVAEAVTALYRSAGYINSRAYIGPQKLIDRTITLSIIETRLSGVTVTGARYFNEALIREAMEMPADRPLRYSVLEDRLRFLNRNPDLKAAAYLAPGTDPRTTELQIKVDDKFPIHGHYEFNNEGTKLTHRARHLVSGIHNNFIGRSDTLSMTAALAEEGAFTAVSGGWSLPLWRTGTTFQITGSYVDSLLVKHLKPAEIKGLSWSVTPSVSQDLINTARHQLALKASFEIKDSKTSIDDFTANLDRMRVLVFGPRWTMYDGTGRTTLAADVHWGIPDLLGGSEAEDLNASRVGAGGDFDYYSASAFRVQRLPRGLIGVFRGSGQWSDTGLTSMERMRLGGSSSVRGYPESDSAGDYGFEGSAELLVPIPVGEDVRVPFTGEPVKQAVRFAGFWDAGKVYDHDRSSPQADQDRMLMGAGLGVRVDLKNSLSIRFDYAWPLGDDSTDQADQPQAHLSVRVGY